MSAELFQTTVPDISMRLRNIGDEGELPAEATLQRFLTVRREVELDSGATHKESLSVRQEGPLKVTKTTSLATKGREPN